MAHLILSHQLFFSKWHKLLNNLKYMQTSLFLAPIKVDICYNTSKKVYYSQKNISQFIR